MSRSGDKIGYHTDTHLSRKLIISFKEGLLIQCIAMIFNFPTFIEIYHWHWEISVSYDDCLKVEHNSSTRVSFDGALNPPPWLWRFSILDCGSKHGGDTLGNQSRPNLIQIQIAENIDSTQKNCKSQFMLSWISSSQNVILSIGHIRRTQQETIRTIHMWQLIPLAFLPGFGMETSDVMNLMKLWNYIFFPVCISPIGTFLQNVHSWKPDAVYTSSWRMEMFFKEELEMKQHLLHLSRHQIKTEAVRKRVVRYVSDLDNLLNGTTDPTFVHDPVQAYFFLRHVAVRLSHLPRKKFIFEIVPR